MTITKERRDEIRAAAMKATPGPWFAEINPTSGWVGTPKGEGVHRKCDDVFFGESFADYRSEYVLKKVGLFEFIANCDPQTILALLDALDAAESAEPVAWVIPGDDNARPNGAIDAMAWQEGEFSRPLYAAPPAPAIPEGWVLVRKAESNK